MTNQKNDNLYCKLYVGNAPRRLKRQTKKARKVFMANIRHKLLRKMRESTFKYYCSICLIIRDENEYLLEWLNWHIAAGVEHFYIYDHGSEYSVKQFVSELGFDICEKVTVIDWCGSHDDAQPDAYNDCLKRFGDESRWIGFIDADEQVRIKNGQALPKFLKKYEKYAGVMAVWLLYDADGQVKSGEGLLRDRFKHVNRSNSFCNCAGKVFVQPLFMEEMVIHNGQAKIGFEIVDEHKKHIENYKLWSDAGTTDFICIDHYYTKSYEEWLKKIRRGSAHAKFSRRYDEFFDLNTDMEYCREDIELVQKYEQTEEVSTPAYGKTYRMPTDSKSL